MSAKRTTAASKKKRRRAPVKAAEAYDTAPRRPAAVRERASSATDWHRVRTMTDASAHLAALADVDNLPADAKWLAAGQLKQPVRKQPISLRVDADVLEWFKATGPLYQSRMNDVLKAYVTYQQQRRGRRAGRPRKG